VDVKPQEVTYTFNSAPSGLRITYAGSSYTTPFKVKTYINAKRIIEAPLTTRGRADLRQLVGWRRRRA
jgi:hypothetical protein